MKSTLIKTAKRLGNTCCLFATLMVVTIVLNPVYANSVENNALQLQENERTVKGVISDENGVLEGVNVVLKGSNEGTVTNSKGEFTFPKKLKKDDVLVLSYLGYETVMVRIKEDTTFIEVTLNEDLIEFVGEVNTNALYKSKRSKKHN